ncbi:GNAT family N-acetyltransferase [Parapusillimonas granuli]|uniref:GNAT family N-acetyltransferase n=1 Tax=Parapusillimonas granuli TaxID=380911 RepID=A0A853G2Q5_9BURK|nr:GNAT family protein [Parapusillimonas granuli]MBB5214968.1 RimJ/RimL family protein N-acetyltransferase [Parapusillimonas granuli]MEB2401173.1 GNAT family protein [Alcaligenaceae bacterium]NYT49290.1 GNAT family N-acetyltransferase [Parapusillimonas granuli]
MSATTGFLKNPGPTTLEGHGVRLAPLDPAHAAALEQAAADGELWRLRVTSVPAPGEAAAYISAALAGRDAGHMLPFAVIEAGSGRVIGTTRYHDIVPAIGRLEIGYTWYAKSWQRSHVNTASKLLLLAHAFEDLGAQLVGWRTDNFNFASQRAIERLGAKKDGVLRHHAPRRDGSVRDTVMYSMARGEWPEIRKHLEYQLARHAD